MSIDSPFTVGLGLLVVALIIMVVIVITSRRH